MERIASFSVDHDKIETGIYVSRIDGDIITYDLRTRKPNGDDYIDDVTMHSVEHMMATYLRNSDIGSRVIYFGPMGCRTGFYLLVRDLPNERVLEEVKLALKKPWSIRVRCSATHERNVVTTNASTLTAPRGNARDTLRCLRARKILLNIEKEA